MDLIKRVKAARRVGVPIVGITTADQYGAIDALRESKVFNGAALILWDCVRGWSPLNDVGSDAIGAVLGGESPALTTGQPFACLERAPQLPGAPQVPGGTVLFMLTANRWLQADGVSQGIMNLRDIFKADERMLVILGPSIQLPAEISSDVLLIDEELPGRPEIEGIVSRLLTDNGLPVDPVQVSRAGDALAGIARFPAEQSAAIAITRAGVDVAECWARKKAVIESVPGLWVDRESITFEQLAGIDGIRELGAEVFNEGPFRPKLVVRVDEMEKSLAGAGSGGAGDSSGTSQDQVSQLLVNMEDNGFNGCVGVGPGGGGKTAFSQALGASYGVPTVRMDLGAMKDIYVGGSEARIRAAMKAIVAIAGYGGAFWVATVNALSSVPAPLLRRFRSGIWYFDLLGAAERKAVWAVNLKRFNVPEQPLPDDDGWSGAEIRNCCELSQRHGITLVQQAKRIVPVSRIDPEGVRSLREKAQAGEFLSAQTGLPYRMPAGGGRPAVSGRRVQLGGE